MIDGIRLIVFLLLAVNKSATPTSLYMPAVDPLSVRIIATKEVLKEPMLDCQIRSPRPDKAHAGQNQ